jgi:diguanylate cyclase (GGDEF)-like protein/PAS domain S-box-containing protein
MTRTDDVAQAELARARALLAVAPLGIGELLLDGTLLWANQALADLFDDAEGDATALVGTDGLAFLRPDDRPDLFNLPPEGRATVTCRAGRPGASGTIRVHLKMLSPVDDQGPRVAVYVEDTTEYQRRLSRAFSSGDAPYARLLDSVRDVVTVVDEQGTVITNLGFAESLLGWDPDQWVGRSVFEFCHPDELADVRAAFSALLDLPGVPIVREFRARQVDGRFSWLQFTGVNLLSDPDVGAIVLVTRNMAKDRAATALQAEQSEVFEAIARGTELGVVLDMLMRILVDHIPECRPAVWLHDQGMITLASSPNLPPQVVEYVNRIPSGWPSGAIREAILTNRVVEVADVSESSLYDTSASRVADEGLRAVIAFPVPIIDDSAPRADNVTDELDPVDPASTVGTIAAVVTIHLTEARLLAPHERAVATGVARLAEIAIQRHRTELRLSRLAHYDKLTDLPNRALVQSRLDEGIALARRHNTSLAVMFCDMDNFKIVNDSLGHAAGDQILIGFAERLRVLLRPTDTIGRFGGDEFVVLLENVASHHDAVQVAERLLDDLRRPFQIDDNTVFLTVSIGIAVSYGGRGSGETLLRDADSAMYQAKERGRSRIEIYDAGLPERATARLHMESDLRAALDLDQFRILWQPKISLTTGRIVCAEALVRWHHPVRGEVMPDEFVPIAEETEMIREVGEWVLEQSIRQQAQWLDKHGDAAPVSVAVNVSALQLTTPAVLALVLRVLGAHGLPPERLMLELTESVLMSEGSQAAQLLLRLRDVGVKVAIDDFGTGYSSLSYLHRYPVDALKLDRSFVSGVQADGEGSPIARAVINMAHALGISVTAEGVETPAQLAGLRALGCDWAQGFLLGKPMPADEFAAVMVAAPSYW